jgi:glycosyltransferase involved in cell wall biosynthesis
MLCAEGGIDWARHSESACPTSPSLCSGSHVFILIEPQRPLLFDDLQKIGSPVYHLVHRSAASHFANLLAVLRILRAHRVGILHASLPYGNLIGLIAGSLLRIRVRVTTCENPSWARDQGSRKQDLIDRLTYRLATRVVVCTEIGRDYLARTYGVPIAKMELIGHSLKLSDYDDVSPARIAAQRQKLGLREGDFVVGMVARLEAWKGHQYAVEAIKLVAQQIPTVRLLIFGSRGQGYDELERWITLHGVADNVEYKGFVDDNIALYRLFDVHLHVPVNELVESFGITIIEGMVSGCAQVLTRSGVSVSVAQHMQNAWLVDYRSPAAIAEALLALHADPGLRARLGETARRDARRHFDYRDKVDRHLEVYGLQGKEVSGAASSRL